MSPTLPTLHTLAPSHFSERARWGLDWLGIAYAEHRVALRPHVVFLKSKGLPDTTLPVWSDADALIQGSGAILDHVGLPATDPAFETRFERDIGPLVRRFIHAAAFASEDPGMRDVLLEGVGPAEKLLGLAAWPALALMLRQRATGPGHLQAVVDEVGRALDWVDGVAADAGGTLASDFGRAHITAASLLYPIASPTPTPTARRPRFSAHIQGLMGEWQRRPSLRWVRSTYEAHRPPPRASP